MSWPGWEDFKPAGPPAPAKKSASKMDRGRRQGAKWVLVDDRRNILEWELAKAHGIAGRKFQSRKEAKRYVVLLGLQDAGEIRNLRCQVDFPLYAKRPDGLLEKVCCYRADFVYDWLLEFDVVEDVKGFRQEIYLLKAKWFRIQYGKPIKET